MWLSKQATDDNIVRLMRIVCCINKAVDIQAEYVILIAFPRNCGYIRAPHYYVTLTLPVLLIRAIIRLTAIKL